jgi:hypothetical protein
MSTKPLIQDSIAYAVASLVPPGIFKNPRYFTLWQDRGYHVTGVHYYSPVPDTRTLKDELWRNPSALVGIDMNEASQLALLSELITRYAFEHEGAEAQEPAGPDWTVLYCMIRHFKPRRIIEIGAGLSTRVSAAAVEANCREAGFQASLVAIEPYPTPDLVAGFAGLSELKQVAVQDVPLDEFQQLGENDILFIDSTHVMKIGSDVHYEFLEIIPRLRRGVIIHVHDIFLPYEYPRDWIMERSAFWNEAYILQAFLAFNSAFEVLLANSYLHHRHPDAMKGAFGQYYDVPGSFWMRRVQ